MSRIEKVIDLPQSAVAPVEEGTVAGNARYLLDGEEVGAVPILYAETVAKAVYKDYLKQIFELFLL